MIRNQKNRLFTIYAIQCSVTGRVYIGSTSAFEQRVKAHFSELRRGAKQMRIYDKNEYGGWGRGDSTWQMEYKMYGEDAFDVYVIEENIDFENQAEREGYYMNYYDATNPEFGYNIKNYCPKKTFKFSKGLPKKMQA